MGRKKIAKSFWGDPTFEVKNKDIAHTMTMIRTITEGQTDRRALRTATNTLHAVAAYVASRFGVREILAILDNLRIEIMGTQV
jgi:hypothetical protein